jgi:hypothetical protein
MLCLKKIFNALLKLLQHSLASAGSRGCREGQWTTFSQTNVAPMDFSDPSSPVARVGSW